MAQRCIQQHALTPPSVRQLERWAEVCRYVDAQPYRSVKTPFPDDPPMSAKLLKHMAQFNLVRHRDDCRWQVSPRWQGILNNLARGITDDAPHKPQAAPQAPFVVDYGVDTMYVNVLAEEVPAPFLALAYQLKERAQGEYKSVETPWLFGGIPLSLLPNGKAVSDAGGVSWGLIFRNKYVEIRLRKAPVSGIVAMVHFLAECLWLHQPKHSLDLMVRCLSSMWSDPKAFKEMGYQLSQIHLCADIAHFPLILDHLPNLVTHSIKREVHVPSLADLDLDDTGLEPGMSYSDDYDDLINGLVPDGWGDDEGEVDDVVDLPSADDFDDDDEEAGDSDDDEEAEESDEQDETRWDADGGKVHWRGQRVEGIGFSPAGALSAAWYDKILEERKALHKKPWMREIHKVGGWQPGMTLTRLEYRAKRPILNVWEVALGQEKGARWFDDPWVAMDHLGDMWAFYVGLPEEYDLAPDSTYRGWMRLTTPNPQDSRRSRWPTAPLWEVVQRVPFNEGMPKPLRRVKQAKPDLSQLDAEIFGMLITRAMLRGAYMQGPAQMERELEAFDDRMHEEEEKKVASFAGEVRERARMHGQKIPYQAPMVLPRRPRGRPAKGKKS